MLTVEDIMDKYEYVAALYDRNEPEWYTNILDAIDSQFIQTQRLHPVISDLSRLSIRHYSRLRSSRMQNLAVERFSKDIVNELQNVSTKYADESQNIDREFPRNLADEWKRLKNTENPPRYEPSSLDEKLKLLEEKRNNLIGLGLFEGHEAPPLVTVDEDLAGVFSIYVDDVERKFSVFDEISEQLQIFTDIINSRFQHKRLTINKRDGFVIEAQGGAQRIPLESLSSGEQHELVLFYHLLFEAKPDSLILIDEPEISLHVNWQEKFLDDIKRVADLRKFDVLIATHSPDIIGDKDEWMVDLGRQENE